MLAFHDTDTDADSPNTASLNFVRHTLFPCENPREEVAFLDADTDMHFLADILARFVTMMSACR